MYASTTIQARSRKHCRRGKEISITYSGCVSVFLVIQLPKRMRLIILLSVAFAALQYFFTLSHYFLYKFVCNISNSKSNPASYYYKCIYVFM